MLEENKIHLGDCLDLLPSIPSKSVDMVLCDLPYGITDCSWDSIIDLSVLWQQYERVIKDNGAIVLTANSHFVFTLHASNPKLFRYEWIWEKTTASGFLNANLQPLRNHENVLVFYKKQPIYNPQLTKERDDSFKYAKSQIAHNNIYGERNYFKRGQNIGYPKTILKIPHNNHDSWHPTQKPVALFEYLIKTYTNEGDLVLDNCSGSGTTAIACINTNRRYICMERDETYYRKSIERMNNHEPLFHLGNN